MANEIATRRHPQIAQKERIWSLISDSYAGGDVYLRGSHLIQYPKESTVGHEARKKRSVYFNHVQPLADMLAGFIYSRKIERKIPTQLQYMVEQASKRKSLDSFIQTVAIHSLLYTCGILVDSPSDAGEYLTEADRQEAGKNPYCVLYMPNRIRDFYCDDEGCLEWVLLDNSTTDASDPLKPGMIKKVYRLWTRTEIIDYNIEIKNNQSEAQEIARREHTLGVVPFIFVNWRDVDEDYICETPFEDIALLDRQIYNCLSYLDEMLAAGTFKMLFFPVGSKEDIPQAVIDAGVGGSSFVVFNMESKSPPFFAGHTLDDVAPFVSAMQMYMGEIYSKVGLDKDQEKLYVQSGVAKDLEFQKCEAMLRLGAKQLEQTEKKIFELAAMWTGGTADGVEITYGVDFQSDRIDDQLTRLYTLSMQPFEKLKKASLKKIVGMVLADLPEQDRTEIIAEIDAAKKQPEVANMVKQETAAQMPQGGQHG